MANKKAKEKKAKKEKATKEKASKATAAIPAAQPADNGLIEVTAKIAPTPNPADLMLGFQIDSKPLTLAGGAGRAKVSTGVHTASWALVSPTVRPLGFAVTITAADGRVLLNRPNEKTGADGLGLGADLFSA